MRIEIAGILLAVTLNAVGALAPAPAGAIDGVIEINSARALVGGVTIGDAPGYPVTLSQSGSYRLTGILTVQDQTAIEITAEGVRVDLNGFGIECATTCASGSGIQATASGVWVRNGYVRGMGEHGISLWHRAMVEGVEASSNGGIGIFVLGGCMGWNLRAIGNVGSGIICPGVLRDSVAHDNQRDGMRIVHGVASGNEVTSNGVTVPSDDANGMTLSGGVASGNTIRGSAQHGIRIQQPTVVLGNSITDNTFYGLFSIGFGDLGYAENILDDNLTGALGCVIGVTCLEVGGNLCNGNGVCP